MFTHLPTDSILDGVFPAPAVFCDTGLEYAEIGDFVNVDGDFTGMCWDGDAFWFGAIYQNQLFHVDLNGDGIDILNVAVGGDGVFGVAWDGESLWYANAMGNRTLYNISVEGDEIREVNCGNIEGAEWASIVWIPEHEDGHMWLLGCEAQVIYQLNVEEDDAVVIRETRIDHQETYGIGHDTVNLWYQSFNQGWFIMDDGIEEPKWIDVEPREGEIAGDNAATVQGDFIIDDDGRYSFRIFSEYAPAVQIIRKEELLEIPQIDYDPTEVLSSLSVGYCKDWKENEYLILHDRSREAEVFEKSNTRRSKFSLAAWVLNLRIF